MLRGRDSDLGLEQTTELPLGEMNARRHRRDGEIGREVVGDPVEQVADRFGIRGLRGEHSRELCLSTGATQVHDQASSNATVIEVRAPTKIGVLHRITKALAEVGLDIRHATVQTIGMEVVDTFYVRTWSGDLVTDPVHRREVERAVLHAVQ